MDRYEVDIPFLADMIRFDNFCLQRVMLQGVSYLVQNSRFSFYFSFLKNNLVEEFRRQRNQMKLGKNKKMFYVGVWLEVEVDVPQFTVASLHRRERRTERLTSGWRTCAPMPQFCRHFFRRNPFSPAVCAAQRTPDFPKSSCRRFASSTSSRRPCHGDSSATWRTIEARSRRSGDCLSSQHQLRIYCKTVKVSQ